MLPWVNKEIFVRADQFNMSFNNNKVLREDFASEAVHFDFMIMRMFLFIKVLVFVYFLKTTE